MNSEVPSILVVDDDVDTCHNLADILEDFDYRVDMAHDGESALEKIKRVPYKIALIDFRMPGMDGLTLYRNIKQIRSGTVALIVSAYASSETAEEAENSGVWKVLSKPVDVSQLMPLVDEAASQPLVMVVDDDTDLCSSLWDLLREQGYRVCLAHDETEARNRLQGASYRVILIDMKLPKGDGNRVFRLVRETDPETRVVMITGFRDEVDPMIQQALSEGAGTVFYKPFDVPKLLEAVQKLTD